jgi:RNA polymerase sigma-70 factor, ECF subfamily
MLLSVSLLCMSISGTEICLEEALPRAYIQLCRLAGIYLSRVPARARPRPEAAVHETYLLLKRQRQQQWRDLPHFVGTTATLLRRVILDLRRSQRTAKRGGATVWVDLEEGCAVAAPRGEDVLALEEALTSLERRDPRQSQVVRLRFLAGLTVEETATALEVAPTTVRRDWAAARQWLRHRLAS